MNQIYCEFLKIAILTIIPIIPHDSDKAKIWQWNPSSSLHLSHIIPEVLKLDLMPSHLLKDLCHYYSWISVPLTSHFSNSYFPSAFICPQIVYSLKELKILFNKLHWSSWTFIGFSKKLLPKLYILYKN